MAKTSTLTLKGADELVAKFRALSASAQRYIALPAAKAAMEIVRDDAINRAQRIDDPRTPANISLNIRMAEDKAFYDETGAVKVSVGVRKKRGPGGKTWYWYYQELGTVNARAQPFMRPALSQNLQAMFSEFLSVAKYELIKQGVN
jgi:HK97 gp10 family phage protein